MNLQFNKKYIQFHEMAVTKLQHRSYLTRKRNPKLFMRTPRPTSIGGTIAFNKPVVKMTKQKLYLSTLPPKL